jgi:Zn-dependent peptidase ImmA (M78 family)
MNKLKIFDSNRVTKKQLRALICAAAKQFGVNRTVFSNKAKRVRGTYNVLTGILYIDTKQSKKETLLTFFHELGHHFAVKKRKWNKYHYNLVKCMAIEDIFNTENKVDGVAKDLWNKHVNSNQWGKYKYMYPRSKKRKIMNQLISDNLV